MIIYDKSFWGLGLLSRLYGSAIPRTLPAGLLSALLTTLLLFFRESTTSWWVHPFPYNIFSFVVGFIIVFRSNYGYQRYWDARSQVQTMTMKWQEAVVHIAAFDRFTLPEQPKPEQLQQEQRFIRLLVHLVSLMQVSDQACLASLAFTSHTWP
jgi:predicted membrane chloride channel (bestrophin family)